MYSLWFLYPGVLHCCNEVQTRWTWRRKCLKAPVQKRKASGVETAVFLPLILGETFDVVFIINPMDSMILKVSFVFYWVNGGILSAP